MNPREAWQRARAAWQGFWRARNRRERNMLLAGAAACALAATYALLIAPAVTGTAALRRGLPALRQQAAQMRQLAAQAAQQKAGRKAGPEAAAAPAAADQAPLAMTRESIKASLQAAGLAADGIDVTGQTARLQFAAAAAAGLIAWLEQAQAQSLTVTDVDITMQDDGRTASGTVTLATTEEERQ